MAKEVGVDWRVLIETAVPGTYAEIVNQRDLTVDFTPDTVDASVKSDAGWASQIITKNRAEVSFSGIVDQGDSTYQLLEDAFFLKTRKLFRVQNKPTSPTRTYSFGAQVGLSISSGIEDFAGYEATLFVDGVVTKS